MADATHPVFIYLMEARKMKKAVIQLLRPAIAAAVATALVSLPRQRSEAQELPNTSRPPLDWVDGPETMSRPQSAAPSAVLDAPMRFTQATALTFSGPIAGPGFGGQSTTPAPAGVEPVHDDGLTPDERVNIAVYENVNRSVVNINTKGVRGELFFIELPSEGAGSGSVLDKDGHILTNYHVIEGAREVQVTLFDGKAYSAELVGEDPSTDIAVIKIKAPPDSLYPVVLGDSNRLRVGQRVFAIGNPFGLERTLTTGVVSSLNRSLPSRNNRSMKSIIQIDAAINPGNSGGPLLDTRARLIGMNTAIASRTGQSTGVGFAIPVSSIARVVPQLIEKGRVIRPDIGIARVYESEKGLLIATLVPGGPAEAAGLRGPRLVRERRRQGPFLYEYQSVDRSAADLILAVDGKRIATADEFLSAIESKQPQQDVTLTIVRDGKELDVHVRLGENLD
ncbi:MAG TPA: trypsin-like peptidase domain-containing protein [Pirellulales bacterium]|jgi:S1-C subfamily serine protease|nr:trypsin-like peptidase domain-containing protein [Pirellulales bacterium]